MSQGKDGKASPQQRAAEHLKKILRSAAVGGAALGLSSGCGSCGPMVCDPLPPPICDENPTTATFLSGYLDATATWQQRDAGGLMVHFDLELHGQGASVYFDADPAVAGGLVVGVLREPTTLSLDFVPDPGVTRVEVVVPLTCELKPEMAKLGLDVSSPQAGSAVTITSLE